MSNPDGVDGPRAAEIPASAASHAPPAAVSLFARRLSHDLNNFATVVRTYSELLLNDLPAGSTRDDVNEIHRAADAMVAYLQRVTRFSRTGGLKASRVVLMAAARDVADDYAEARGRAPVEFVGTDSASVHVDDAWLRDVLHELIDNAREAAPPESVIHVDVSEQRDESGTRWAVVTVRDRGPGFAETVATTAEDPFVTTKEGVRGAGFGLTLASAFASASGGRLQRRRDGDSTAVALWLRVAD